MPCPSLHPPAHPETIQIDWRRVLLLWAKLLKIHLLTAKPTWSSWYPNYALPVWFWLTYNEKDSSLTLYSAGLLKASTRRRVKKQESVVERNHKGGSLSSHWKHMRHTHALSLPHTCTCTCTQVLTCTSHQQHLGSWGLVETQPAVDP